MTVLERLRNIQPSESLNADEIFDAISFAGTIISCYGRESADALEVAIRLLSAKDKGQVPLGCFRAVEYLAEECGFYQYIAKENFNLITQSVIEAHSVTLDRKCHLHAMQMQALLKLLGGENLILSAPTSFGKSILVDAYISLKRPRTVVIVLPTIALIDETRRRLKATFQDYYDFITSATIAYNSSRPTIFILTQERFILREDIQSIDFLFVDEFYKLDPDRKDGRFETLNIALYKALKIARQSFMAGPNISHIEVGVEWVKNFTFLHTSYNTVSVNVVDRSGCDDKLKVFLADLREVRTESSLIFTSSPGSAQSLLDIAVNNDIGSESALRRNLSDWLAANYHSEWPLAAGVRRGIAIHHGRLPRSLGQLFISLFDKGLITILFCTSTLIEGVNTSAANVFVYDKKINRTDFDFFSFANIRGRVGRMMRHFVGNAYLYHEPPEEIETSVTVPVLLDPGASTEYILMNVDYDSLSYEGRQRQEELPEKTGLAEDVLKNHGGLGVNVLVLLREKIQDVLLKNPKSLMWSGKPSNSQRRVLAELVVFAAKQKNEGFGRLSFKQVSWAWSQLFYYKKTSGFLYWFTNKLGRSEEIDSSIDRVFQFLQACEFKFPQKVMAIESIVKSLVPTAKLDYSFYAAALESWFRPAWMKQLDEIGVPLPLSEKMARYLDSPISSDDAILQISKLNLKKIPDLGAIDKYLLKTAIAGSKGGGVQLQLG
ncbi:helicase-like protein [Pseudomonas sp. AG1028]|uniref:DEAD/DEAH box helicase n=1 Tax=Pseudomonas sp. AG1028 TaxID=2572911 RepID=UPI0011ACA17A|nr:DEAD/DEAH box helicase [Pseudomonas sp. AG1028]TWE05936.1 helicase-like protein [Pseudomonas sp. AG1028]